MKRYLLAVSVAAFGGLLLTTSVFSRDPKPDTTGGSAQLHEIMMQGMKTPMSMTGDMDQDFASMMIAHHRQAIAMGDVELKQGHNAELQAMVRKMSEEQKKEIEELQRFTQH